MSSDREMIEARMAAELARRGAARRASRARVIAAGFTDDDIDQMIKQAQKDVEPAAWTKSVWNSDYFLEVELYCR